MGCFIGSGHSDYQSETPLTEQIALTPLSVLI